jgi:stage II sporulation protein AA (anti-sigma F factor antagonist)
MTGPLADVHFERAGAVVIGRVHGEIDMSNAEYLGTAFNEVPPDARALILDLHDVGYLDSAGLRMIYKLRSRLEHRGQQFRLVVAPGAPIIEALRIAGIPQAIGAVETVDAALDSLEA